MKYVECDLCSSDNWFVRYPATLKELQPQVEAFRCTSPGYGEHTQIVECAVCGHVYANPTWEPAELLQLYADVEDATYETERDGRRLTFRKHLDHFEQFAGTGNGRTLLDVGAYTGVFVEIAQEAGWLASGIEPSSWASAQAQKRGLNIIEGTLDAPELVGQQFDAITMWDVIEHVQFPRAELEKSFALLKPGGAIAVHTMDVASPFAKIMGKRWPWYMAMHVHFFSQASLARLMRDVGFEIAWVGAEGRYLRLGYLATRLGGLQAGLGRVSSTLIDRANLATKPIPINFGDLFTAIGKKPV